MDGASGRRELTIAVVGCVLVVALVVMITGAQLLTQRDPRWQAGAVPASLALLGVVAAAFLIVQDSVVWGRWRRWVIPCVWATIVASLLAVWLTDSWALMALAMAAAVLAMPSLRGLLVALGVLLLGLASPFVSGRSGDRPWVTVMGALVTVVAAAFVLYTITRLAVVLGELWRTRERLARFEVDAERNRISRDLHDILGRTLVAASLRNQTAIRLLDVDPQQARVQMEELQHTVTEGQAKLRALTTGPTIVGLQDELEAARSLLARLGIAVDIETVPVRDEATDKAMAAVVREALTNMLKHSRARRCSIGVRNELSAVVVTIVNDGAPVEPPRSGPLHTGLADLADRIVRLGGHLTSGPVAGGRFRVLARIPTADAPAQALPIPAVVQETS